MERCSSFTYCGIKDKHPEYTSEMNRMKCAIKKKSDAIKQLEEELEGINNFQSQSEHQFIKAFTPRMMKVNPEYKTNRSKLLRDIRILRKFFGGKIPEETTVLPRNKLTLRFRCGSCGSRSRCVRFAVAVRAVCGGGACGLRWRVVRFAVAVRAICGRSSCGLRLRSVRFFHRPQKTMASCSDVSRLQRLSYAF